MAKKNRIKKLWHIPKRGNVHQTIFMVHKLNTPQFNNKVWSTQKQESLASALGRAGLTDTGKALSHQSIRTLLANIPQYLGFVGKKNDSRSEILFVTKAGEKLISEFPIERVVQFENSGRTSSNRLKTYQEAGKDIRTSTVFRDQMAKLIITNPNLASDCINIRLFPFIYTLRVLKQVGYLDKEEIAYILFHAPSDGYLNSTVARIRNFRLLSQKQREYEIDEYKKTEEGQLTLVKAATASYFGLLCESTGICQRQRVSIKNRKGKISALEICDERNADVLLRKYSDIEAFDFGENLSLWNEYIGNPDNQFPPFTLEVRVKHVTEALCSVTSKSGNDYSDVINKENKFSICIPVFSGMEYEVECYDIRNGDRILYEKFIARDGMSVVSFEAREEMRIEQEPSVHSKIRELLAEGGYPFDRLYSKKLELILEHFGKNFTHNVYKGGRLEHLFFQILKKLEHRGFVEDVIWNGSVGKYGVALPAPGKTTGEPDMIFRVGGITYVLELTTIGATTMQWNAEGSSVPAHIEGYKRRNPNERVQGIFSAPQIYHRNEEHLRRSLEHTGTRIVFVDCFSFSEKLEQIGSEAELKQYLGELR